MDTMDCMAIISDLPSTRPSDAAAATYLPAPAVAARPQHGSKIYGAEGTEVGALDDVNVSFAAGQFTAPLTKCSIPIRST